MASTRRSLQLGLGIAISAAFLWLAFRDVAFGDVLRSIRSANALGILATVAAGLLSIVSRAQRWVPLFRPGAGVTVRHAFASQCVGFAGNTVLPFRAGEALKAYALSQRSHQPFTKVLATVVLERVFDLLGLAVTLGLAMAFVPIPESAGAQVNGAIRLLSVVMAGTAVFILAFVFLRRRMLGLVDAVLVWFPAAVAEPLMSAVHAFVDGLNALGRPRQLLQVVCLSLWVWATLALPFAAMSYAFDFGGTHGASSWQVGLVCSAMVAVFVMIPAAPGFVGTFQAGCIVALAVFGVPRDAALGFALLVHFLTLAPVTVIGLVLAFRQGLFGPGAATRLPEPDGGSAGDRPGTGESE